MWNCNSIELGDRFKVFQFLFLLVLQNGWFTGQIMDDVAGTGGIILRQTSLCASSSILTKNMECLRSKFRGGIPL